MSTVNLDPTFTSSVFTPKMTCLLMRVDWFLKVAGTGCTDAHNTAIIRLHDCERVYQMLKQFLYSVS